MQTGKIVRTEIDPRLTQYVIASAIAGEDDWARAFVRAWFNELDFFQVPAVASGSSNWDAERVCLVSVEGTMVGFTSLWFPGYLWADTDGELDLCRAFVIRKG